jgi:hypothetical protein
MWLLPTPRMSRQKAINRTISVVTLQSNVSNQFLKITNVSKRPKTKNSVKCAKKNSIEEIILMHNFISEQAT